MQQYVTREMLADLGLSEITDEQLAELNTKIEEEIGVEIAESLEDDQLKELMEMENSASEEDLGKWIAEHVPDYKEIVQDNIDIAIGDFVEKNAGNNSAETPAEVSSEPVAPTEEPMPATDMETPSESAPSPEFETPSAESAPTPANSETPPESTEQQY